jgi:SNF2 family DNA or RNA helicase
MVCTFNKIILTLSNPADWIIANQLTGKIEERAPGQFEMALSTHNLSRIANFFTGDRKPVVISGRDHLNNLVNKLREYKHRRENLKLILDKEMYPVEPNGKFIPYKHQTKIIGAVLHNPYTMVGSACGTGKTGSLARAIELELNAGNIKRGGVLVTAPLSILHTSWHDDITKFTDLRCCVLWAPLTNKTILSGEKIVLTNLGERPASAVAVKTKTGNWFKNDLTGKVKQTISALDGTHWTKYKASCKCATDLDGTETLFGDVVGKVATKELTRENFVKEQLNRDDVDVYLINHDGVRIYEDILKEKEFDWIVIDESTKIKNPSSSVSRAHVSISWKAKRRNTLSGTPNPNGFIDLWQQYYFLDRGLTFEPCLKDFLKEYFTPEIVGYTKTPGGKKAAIKYRIKDEGSKNRLIERARSVGIFLEQRDCIDLPERVNMNRAVFMTPAQESAYIHMTKDLVAELRCVDTNSMVEAEALNVLSKIMKLRQITGGFLMNSSGEVLCLENNPKWNDLDDFIEELGEQKLVIVCQFKEEIIRLLERYKHLGAKAIYGDIPVLDRASTVRSFQTDPNERVIILQPQAAGHGITLTAAHHMFFTSLDYNFEYYFQVAKRIERLGQKNSMCVVHSVARFADGESTIDEDLLEILQRKERDRDALFQPGIASLADITRQLASNIISRAERSRSVK